MDDGKPDESYSDEAVEAAADEVLEDVAELGDPEGAPALPSAALAAAAAAAATATGPDAATDEPAVVSTQPEREIWGLAWPVILSQVLASAVSLVDIAMVGRLTREAVAAVGYTTQYVWLTQSVIFSIGIACVAMMSRAVGAGEPDRARSAFAATLVVALTIALAITGVAFAAPEFLLGLLDAQPEIVELAVPYLLLVVGTTPLLAVSLTIESAMRAVKDTRTPMIIAASITVVKTVLNGLLIFGLFGFPRLELVGAGIATVVSLVLGLVLFVAAVLRKGTDPVLRLRPRHFIAARAVLPQVVRISLPAVGERVLMNSAMMTYFTLLGTYGSAAIAAYTIGIRILSFTWIPGVGFSVASSTLVGQSLGASRPEDAARAGWRAVRMAVQVSIVLGVIFAIGREPLARAFSVDEGVITELIPFMLLLALSQPLLGLHFTLAGALRGAGDTMTPLIAAGIGNWVFRVPLAYLVTRVFELPVIWVWWCLVFDHVARGTILAIVFRRGRWKERLGAEV
ncbi:MAG: MATE family efflux transporter [Deltaproteobacteria bacterium]|nr:MATE family efflux transporter [Deltaproteobacteria bacterium]